MVMAIDTLTRLCPGVLFDWRLYAERGSPRYHHQHTDGRRTDDCELTFIKKVVRALPLPLPQSRPSWSRYLTL